MDQISVIVPENLEVLESINLREKLTQLISSGNRHFALNFSKCKFIDVAALGVLVSVNNKCKTLNGSLKLEQLNV